MKKANVNIKVSFDFIINTMPSVKIFKDFDEKQGLKK